MRRFPTSSSDFHLQNKQFPFTNHVSSHLFPSSAMKERSLRTKEIPSGNPSIIFELSKKLLLDRRLAVRPDYKRYYQKQFNKLATYST